jgi:hypothetical protein
MMMDTRVLFAMARDRRAAHAMLAVTPGGTRRPLPSSSHSG